MVVAAILAAGASVIPRRVREGISIVTSAAVCGVSTLLLLRASHLRMVYWFGGWRPRGGVALGIGFTIDPFGAALATMIGLLVTAALLYSWPFFESDPEPSYHVLMLVFLGAMIGFALTGDLFDLFVFFELMSVAAYALTGMEVEHRGPLQGAINFGVMNSLGGFSILLGIALVYGRTGALNLAQIGETLATRPPEGLVVMAFTLLAAGLMVKASVVPFHFWLDDAHAVAPTTVCVLFSGVMVQLGLYGVARVYWTAFSAPFAAHQAALGHVLLGFGTVTALVGAIMAFLQRHLKRLLAFSTISHMGLFLIGVALFSQIGLAGVAVFVLSHGLAKAALFLSAGIVLYRLKNIDTEDLRGQGRRHGMFGIGVLFLTGGLSLAGLPPFGAYVGKTLIEDAASKAGYPWVAWILGVSAALAGGAVLRATARIFLGWGPQEEDRFPRGRRDEEASSEVEHRHEKTPVLLVAPAALLLAGSLAFGLVPGLSPPVERAAANFQDRTGYVSAVLGGQAVPDAPVEIEPPSVLGVYYGIASTAAAIVVALVALMRRRLVPASFRKRIRRTLGPSVVRLRAIHSGHAGDYAAWFVVGVAVLGSLVTVAVR